jgi:hypothetical protein
VIKTQYLDRIVGLGMGAAHGNARRPQLALAGVAFGVVLTGKPLSVTGLGTHLTLAPLGRTPFRTSAFFAEADV